MNLLCRGTVMVGAAYAIDSKYFEEIGTYDEGMTVWGGENLEMAWRVCLQNKGLAYTVYFMCDFIHAMEIKCL